MDLPIFCVCGKSFTETWLREDHFNTVDDLNEHGIPTPDRLREIVKRLSERIKAPEQS